jgi:hypothetical protein
MAGFDVNVGHSRYSFEEFVEQVAHRIQPGLVVMPAVDGPARFDGGYAQVARVSKEALLNKEAVGMLKKR